MKENSTVYNIMCVHIYEHRIHLIQYYRNGHMPENQIFGIS